MLKRLPLSLSITKGVEKYGLMAPTEWIGESKYPSIFSRGIIALSRFGSFMFELKKR